MFFWNTVYITCVYCASDKVNRYSRMNCVQLYISKTLQDGTLIWMKCRSSVCVCTVAVLEGNRGHALIQKCGFTGPPIWDPHSPCTCSTCTWRIERRICASLLQLCWACTKSTKISNRCSRDRFLRTVAAVEVTEIMKGQYYDKHHAVSVIYCSVTTMLDYF